MTKILLTEKQVSELYNVSVGTLRSQRVTGKGMPFVKFGGKILYRTEDIEKYIQGRLFNSTTEYRQSIYS
ncbi:MAG: helix-turn-helix domain-containing protein [Alphaproteobacteria bacterium]|nr:helix-turn-helix domain-containing protein [Alphaproteobacteria bacterium]OJV45486.1 MAG: hypothetical protein BGO28_05165 [Alphaproteobacteria bacterium 43-37]